MCFFQKNKVEFYPEETRLLPMYYQPDESERDHRSRMFIERKKRRCENIRRNKRYLPTKTEE